MAVPNRPFLTCFPIDRLKGQCSVAYLLSHSKASLGGRPGRKKAMRHLRIPRRFKCARVCGHAKELVAHTPSEERRRRIATRRSESLDTRRMELRILVGGVHKDIGIE